jgi:hypothetical protein
VPPPWWKEFLKHWSKRFGYNPTHVRNSKNKGFEWLLLLGNCAIYIHDGGEGSSNVQDMCAHTQCLWDNNNNKFSYTPSLGNPIAFVISSHTPSLENPIAFVISSHTPSLENPIAFDISSHTQSLGNPIAFVISSHNTITRKPYCFCHKSKESNKLSFLFGIFQSLAFLWQCPDFQNCERNAIVWMIGHLW